MSSSAYPNRTVVLTGSVVGDGFAVPHPARSREKIIAMINNFLIGIFLSAAVTIRLVSR
jgi:hypothetical protein